MIWQQAPFMMVLAARPSLNYNNPITASSLFIRTWLKAWAKTNILMQNSAEKLNKPKFKGVFEGFGNSLLLFSSFKNCKLK